MHKSVTQFDDLDLPISLRKGVRSCTQRSITYFMSYDCLSHTFKAIVTNLSNGEIPITIQEALRILEWKNMVLGRW